jgi:uncharacterized radical SAM superfamily Fe-S cluster-containing enzyme
VATPVIVLMREYLTSTQSICRECRRPVSARVFAEDNAIWLEKQCPEHGLQKVRAYGDAQRYLSLGHFHRKASIPLSFATAARGCPDSCGLCPEHEQHICLPIIEITDHCNWRCPICLVNNPEASHRTPTEVAAVLDSLVLSERQIDVLNLSGGEPTLNPYFRAIVEACATRPEILRVSVSTNGSRLTQDPELLEFLAAHRVIVSLQFDGTREETYLALRGRPALAEKLRLIQLCKEAGVSMSLTATVAWGVNERSISEVADLLFRHEHILSAMFQPAAYVGAAAALGRPHQAVTIPDVISALAGAGRGTVSPEDFSPLPCSHPACFALAFYLQIDDNRFVPVRQMVDVERYMKLIQNRAIFGTDPASFDLITEALYELWSGASALSPDSEKTLKAVRQLITKATANGGFSPQRALTAGERSIKSVFVHQFMDPDTFDLSRARKGCQVYPQPDGRMIPACVYNCLRRPALNSRPAVPAASAAGSVAPIGSPANVP